MEDLHSGDELARSWQLLVAVLRVPVPTCGHPRSPACHQPISNDRDGATLAVRVTDKQDWDHRRSCRKIWNYECAPQHEGHLPCIMARMLSIFPVFQLGLCTACFSKKEEKKKKSLWNSMMWYHNRFCVLKELVVCCCLPKWWEEWGKVVPFAMGTAQGGYAPVLVPLA